MWLVGYNNGARGAASQPTAAVSGYELFTLQSAARISVRDGVWNSRILRRSWDEMGMIQLASGPGSRVHIEKPVIQAATCLASKLCICLWGLGGSALCSSGVGSGFFCSFVTYGLDSAWRV